MAIGTEDYNPNKNASNVLKNDIVAELTSNSCLFRKYIADVPYYPKNNIKDLFKNAPWIPENSYTTATFCKDIKLPSDSAIKEDIDVLAMFDSLSTMFYRVALPLTNIRKSQFVFLKKNGSTYSEYSTTKYVALADKAILGTNSKSFANNANQNNRKLITNINDFFTYGGSISSSINALRNSLVKEYSATSHPEIKASTIATLSSYFIDALSSIANHSNLTCKFTDDYKSKTATLTYYKNNDGAGGLSSITTWKYNTVKIKKYSDFSGWGSVQIDGWSSKKNSLAIDYKPNDSLLVKNSSYSFYPVSMKSVTYNGDGDSLILRKNPTNVSRPSYVKAKTTTGSNSIKESVISGTKNFQLPAVGDYFSKNSGAIPTGKTFEFLGWKKTSPSPTAKSIDYSGTSKITTDLTINSDYVFRPVYDVEQTYTGEGVKKIYDVWQVDLRLRNKRDTPHEGDDASERERAIAAPKNRWSNGTLVWSVDGECATFDIKIPLNGACSYRSTPAADYTNNFAYPNKYYSLIDPSQNTSLTSTISIKNLGFKLKSTYSNTFNYVKDMKIKMTIVGNTTKVRPFNVYIYQYSDGAYKTIKSWKKEEFNKGERERTDDTFGVGGKPWNFSTDPDSKPDVKTFSVTGFSKAASNLSKSYIRFFGNTGYSTVHREDIEQGKTPYPYRCRALITIESVTIGTIKTY